MPIRSVAIIGAGTMGSGIATNITQHGYDTLIIDLSKEAVENSINSIHRFLNRSVKKGKLEEIVARNAKQRLTGSIEIAAAENADLIIEAVFERLDIKSELYKKLNPFLKGETIVSTNTSCLTVSGLAKSVDDAGRFLGLHYFNPASINPIVEVVRGNDTRQDTINEAVAFCKNTSKKPILCKDSYGFALNRFFCPYSNEAVRLFEEGLGTPAQIDQIVQEKMGIAAGPFLVMNLVGMKTMAHAAENLEPHGNFYKPTATVNEMGVSNKKWNIEEVPDQKTGAEAKILDRMWGAIFLPVLQELDENVSSPSEIDVGAGLALRFGKAPCVTMDTMGRDEVKRLIDYYCFKYSIKIPASLDRVGALLANLR